MSGQFFASARHVDQWTSLDLITKAIRGRLHSTLKWCSYALYKQCPNKDFAADQTPISRVG